MGCKNSKVKSSSLRRQNARAMPNIMNITQNLARYKTYNIKKDYVIDHNTLYSGKYGEVRKAISKHSGLKRAIKVIYKSK